MTTAPGLTVVEEFVEPGDETRLFLRSWRPEHVRAVVVVVHEPRSDGARFGCLAETLGARGIASCAIDLHGCGRSSSGHRRIEPFVSHLPDVEAMVSRVRRCDPTRPVFMFGHGIGAVIACHYAMRHDGELDGIICEGIVLDPPRGAAILRRFPRLSHVLRLPRAAGFRFDRRLRKPLGNLSVPLLLLHGSEDPVASPADSERFHRHVASVDKTLQVFEGYDHWLIDGPGHALVRDKICQWIEAQLDSSSCRRRIGIEYINE